MRICFALVSLVSAGLIFVPAVAALVTPTFHSGQFLTWGPNQTIMADNNGVVPQVGDWDQDGDKDLLVGTYYDGNVYFYPNTGSNQNPLFESRSLICAEGVPIAVTFG